MAGQVSPGIALRERDLTAQTIVNVQSNTGALVGSFLKGPVGTITNISTEKEFYDTFGKPTDSNYEDWFTGSSFLAYGGQLQVVRVEDTVLKNAISDAGTSTSDASKLFVAASVSFAINDYVKVGSEYFLVTNTTNTAGEKSLTVTRSQLGSTAAASYTSGSAVTKWSFAESGTITTLITEPNATPELTATETAISVTSAASFSASTQSVSVYAKITRTPSGGTTSITSEYVKIVSVDTDTNVIFVERGALGSTAITFEDDLAGDETAAPALRLIQMDFTASGITTTTSQAYPVITVTGIQAPLIKSTNDFVTNFSNYTWKFAARTAGVWANGWKVAWISGDTTPYSSATVAGSSTKWETIAASPVVSAASTDFHIVLLDASNNILETFLYVSSSSTAKDDQGGSRYYVDIINKRSQYIYASGTLVTGASSVTLSSGVDSFNGTVSNIETAYNLFADTEEVDVDFILTGGSLSLKTDQVTKAKKAIGIADSRKDCITFVSPWNGFVKLSSSSAQREEIVSFFNEANVGVGTPTSYAIFDSGYKYVYGRYNDGYRYVRGCGDVAGLCVETSNNLEDWFSPAGTQRGNLKNAVKLAYVPTKTDRDKLYSNRINPITSFAGQGIILFGDKTALANPSAFDRINVRRLFLAIEKKVSRLARNVLFELNDTATRSSFFNAVNSYMAEVQAKRGVTSYLVVCDETNNTADVIDRNEFVAEVYVQPARSINYITLTFVATRTGVSFAEVVGQV
jgi:hypothetical protein